MKTQDVKNFRIFKIAYVPPTNYKGAGVRITETKRYNDDKTKTVTESYCYETGDILQQGIDFLTEKGFNIVGRASDINTYYIFADNWGENFKEIL